MSSRKNKKKTAKYDPFNTEVGAMIRRAMIKAGLLTEVAKKEAPKKAGQ